MQKDYTDVSIVLDRSGSMSSVKGDIIGGYNNFIAEQKKVPGRLTVSLFQFDDIYEVVYAGKDINDVPELTDQTYVPRNMTALHDAIGKSVSETKIRVAALPEDERPEKIVALIMTDGHENASKEWRGADKIKALIEEQEKNGWQFVFIGATQDAIKTGAGLGVSAANTVRSSQAGLGGTYSMAGHNLRSYRTGEVNTMAFTKEQNEKAEEDLKNENKK